MNVTTSENKANGFLHLIRRSRRGRLKIYLGYGAGIGKTYQMLEEGRRLKDAGIDVVIGLLETHGRAETAKVAEGLEAVPRKKQGYRRHILEEMDVDAVLMRKPEVALIDELAHTNVPGGRNAKRYQDVQDILTHGIHVITTLNVQHLESLYDTVERSIHVKVRERLPDSIIGEADEIVNVDLTPSDLRRRLREGKIYPKERIDTALTHFFRTENLEKLRELTLRELASQIDLKMRGRSDEDVSATPDQVMVCLSSRGPNSEMLLRYASRLAGRLNRSWYAVYVQTPREDPITIDAHTQRLLSGTLTLAKQLGAVVFTYKGEDIAETLLRFAKEYRVGHIVIGKPGTVPWWKRMLGKANVVEHLLRKIRGITLVIFDTWHGEPEKIKEITLPLQRPEPATASQRQDLRLGDVLTGRKILIWDRPVAKETILNALIQVAATDIGDCSYQKIRQSVLEREKEGSTFLNEGTAFPHARISGLSFPVLALGLARQGITDVAATHSFHLVFLILSPAHDPTVQIRLLPLVGRAGRDRKLREKLAEVGNSNECCAKIKEWENELHSA